MTTKPTLPQLEATLRSKYQWDAIFKRKGLTVRDLVHDVQREAIVQVRDATFEEAATLCDQGRAPRMARKIRALKSEPRP